MDGGVVQIYAFAWSSFAQHLIADCDKYIPQTQPISASREFGGDTRLKVLLQMRLVHTMIQQVYVTVILRLSLSFSLCKYRVSLLFKVEANSDQLVMCGCSIIT